MAPSKPPAPSPTAHELADPFDREELRQLGTSYDHNRWTQTVFTALAVVISIGALSVFGFAAYYCLSIVAHPNDFEPQVVTSAFTMLTGSFIALCATVITAVFFAGLRGKNVPNFARRANEAAKRELAITGSAAEPEGLATIASTPLSSPGSKSVAPRLSSKQRAATPAVSTTPVVAPRHRIT